jgi:sugar phosphate isomerase/epimerase
MKLSVFTVATPDLTPEQLVVAAKEAGLNGVEWRFAKVSASVSNDKPSYWGNNLCTLNPELPEEEMLHYKRITEAQGLEIVSLTPYLNVDDLDATEHVFRNAALLGAKTIRVGVAKYDGTVPYPELFAKTSLYLKEAERMAKQYGVKGLVETHHVTIAPSAGLAYRLVSQCDPDHIGVLYDPGNMVHEGYEHFKMGMELLGPYLAHVHVKNGAWTKIGTHEDGTAKWQSGWAPLSEGTVNFREVLDYLKSVRYEGYLGIEDFSGQYGSCELLKEFVRFVRERL